MWSVKFEVWSAKSAVCSVRCGVSREGHGRDRVSLNYRSFMFGKLPPPACPGLCYHVTQLPNASSEFYRKAAFLAIFCCLQLLAVLQTRKQLQKKQLPAGKHYGSEGRASSILLPAATGRKTTSKKSSCRQKNTIPRYTTP